MSLFCSSNTPLEEVKIIQASSVSLLESSINDCILDGYRLYGDVKLTNDHAYYIIMVKEKRVYAEDGPLSPNS